MADELVPAAEEESSLELYHDTVRAERLIEVMRYQVANHCSAQKACEACDLAYRTFRDWVSKGILDRYLGEVRAAHSNSLREKAIEKSGDILDHMIQIATGKVQIRGANPVRAAELVLQWAGVSPHEAQDVDRDEPTGPTINILTLVPEQVMFDVKDGAPALSKRGNPVILDASPN